MTGLSTHSRTLGAWLVACLLAVFVATPLLDAAVCRDEAVAATLATDAAAPAALATLDDAKAPAHPDAGGPQPCAHGHCHHASVATPPPSASLETKAPHVQAERPPLSLVLHSIDPALSKPPPRA